MPGRSCAVRLFFSMVHLSPEKSGKNTENCGFLWRALAAPASANNANEGQWVEPAMELVVLPARPTGRMPVPGVEPAPELVAVPAGRALLARTTSFSTGTTSFSTGITSFSTGITNFLCQNCELSAVWVADDKWRVARNMLHHAPVPGPPERVRWFGNAGNSFPQEYYAYTVPQY